MARAICLLWELCQMVTLITPFTNAAGDLARVKLELTDYRLSST